MFCKINFLRQTRVSLSRVSRGVRETDKKWVSITLSHMSFQEKKRKEGRLESEFLL